MNKHDIRLTPGGYVLLKSVKEYAGKVQYPDIMGKNVEVIRYYSRYVHPEGLVIVRFNGEDYDIKYDMIKSENIIMDNEYKSILDEAKEIRSGSRESDYGDAVSNFDRIAKMASYISGKKLSPFDCVSVQIAVKLSRQGYKKKRDNMVDLAGYADIMQQIIDRDEQESGK